MLEELFEFLSKDSLYWFCAIAGTGLFIIQFAITLFFGDLDEGSAEIDSGDFKWLSKQAITGFLMMFGWAGLACRKEFDASGLVTIGVSCAAGLLAVLVSALLFKGASKLRSTGTVFRLEDAIGKEAVVYQRITADTIGKITLSLNHFTHEIEAVSQPGEEIPSFTPVRIVRKIDDKTVLVVSLK